jgi:hypothetical protein
VTAENANGTSPAGEPVVFTAAGVQPGAPTDVVASANGTLTFLPPSSTGLSPITGYTIVAVPAPGSPPGAGNITVSGATSPLELGGLQQGVNYTVYVSALNANRSSLAGQSQIFTYAGNGHGFADARVITLPVHLEGTTVGEGWDLALAMLTARGTCCTALHGESGHACQGSSSHRCGFPQWPYFVHSNS